MNHWCRAWFLIVVALGALEACAAQQSAPPAAPNAAAAPAQQAPPTMQAPVASPAATVTPPASMPSPVLSPPIDEAAVASATHAETTEKSPDGGVKVSFPRKDVEVAVDGWKI